MSRQEEEKRRQQEQERLDRQAEQKRLEELELERKAGERRQIRKLSKTFALTLDAAAKLDIPPEVGMSPNRSTLMLRPSSHVDSHSNGATEIVFSGSFILMLCQLGL